MSILECIDGLSDYWGCYTGQKKHTYISKSRSSGGGIVPLKLSDKEKLERKTLEILSLERKNTRRKNTRRKLSLEEKH